MAENKTKATLASARDDIAYIEGNARRNDREALMKLMTKASQNPPKMWGSSIVGFGSHH